jgi:hypothetical protein
MRAAEIRAIRPQGESKGNKSALPNLKRAACGALRARRSRPTEAALAAARGPRGLGRTKRTPRLLFATDGAGRGAVGCRREGLPPLDYGLMYGVT